MDGATWTPEALVAALLVLVGGVGAAAIQLARSYSSVMDVLTSSHRDQAAVQVAASQAQTAVANAAVASTALGGAGASPIVGMPAWSQLGDIGITPSSASAAMDCGPECVSMCLRVMTGVQTPAAYLRWLVKGWGSTGPTSGDDLVAMFAVNEHKAHARVVDLATMQQEVGRNLAVGRPAIVLGRWLSPMGHWIVVERADEAGLLVRDPYGGTEYPLAWPKVQELFQGVYVHVDERASYTP